jgi:hypothetical protein
MPEGAQLAARGPLGWAALLGSSTPGNPSRVNSYSELRDKTHIGLQIPMAVIGKAGLGSDKNN